MNGVHTTRRPARRNTASFAAGVRLACGVVAAVGLGVLGLRLALDAEEMTGLLALLRPEFAVHAVRWAGVAAIAAAQAVGVTGVVWAGHRRGLLDTLFAAVATVTAVLAGFAAAVLAVIGR